MMPSATPFYSSSPSKQITVIDVYDLAESINRDFEILAEKYGNDPFESIVRKVISALETLEALAKHNDNDNTEIMDLQKTIERFELEKQQRNRDKENLERDILDLEENYKKEIDELCRIVENLQAENKKIKRQIASGDTEANSDVKQELTDEHYQTLIDLRKMTHTQKEQIKQLQKDLGSYCTEVESLRDNIERLIQQNKELLRKNGSLQKQGRTLLLERAELMRRLQQSEENALQLRRVLNETNRACKELEQQSQQDLFMGEDSPRFTLDELRELLQEKNTLKTKVMELEERMEQIRTSSPGMSDNFDFNRENTATPSEVLSAASTSAPKPIISMTPDPEKQETKSGENTEECLVYGPINREPDDKLHPWKYERKNSGVRRFFRIFTALSPSLVPRRSSGAK